MKTTVFKYLALLIILLWTSISSAKEIVMAFSQDIPPYIFQQSNKGIEIDIISAALAQAGHTLKPRYFPLARIPWAFKKKMVDAAMGDMGINLSSFHGFYGDPAVVYDNVFITLQKKHISIKKPGDLDKFKIVSFQGAEKRYPKWLSKANSEHRFFGIANQLTQVKLLKYSRYDVVLSDRYIFKYFVNQWHLINPTKTLHYDEHSFVKINPLDYRPVFNRKKIRDDFNQGLKKIKASGEFQKIYDYYLNVPVKE